MDEKSENSRIHGLGRHWQTIQCGLFPEWEREMDEKLIKEEKIRRAEAAQVRATLETAADETASSVAGPAFLVLDDLVRSSRILQVMSAVRCFCYNSTAMRMCRVPSRRHASRRFRVGDRLATYGRVRSASAPQSIDVCGAYSYDTAGCVMRIERNGRPTLDLAWNGQYQLASVSTNGVFAESYAYDAWSNVLSRFCAEPTLVSVCYPFQGREWSTVTGLIHFRMRWYDSGTGRWLSKDPIGLGGGFNLYVFWGGRGSDPIGGVGVVE